MPSSLRKTERMQSFITASLHKDCVSFRSLQIKGDTFFFIAFTITQFIQVHDIGHKRK